MLFGLKPGIMFGCQFEKLIIIKIENNGIEKKSFKITCDNDFTFLNETLSVDKVFKLSIEDILDFLE